MRMNAIIMAGDVLSPEDKLYPYFGGGSKAMIEVAGKPMIQWVIDALDNSEKIDHIIVVGLTAASGITSEKPVIFINRREGMLANIVAGVNKSLEINPDKEYVMVVSSDIPSVEGQMADWVINTAMETKDDIYYGVCTREMMESRFPTSNRTYVKLRDMEVCGSDMNIIHVSMAKEHLHIWEALIGHRKTPLRQAGVIGPGILLGLLLGRFSLIKLAERVSARIGIKARAFIWNCAEPCMDVDKPHQLDLMRAEMEKKAQDPDWQNRTGDNSGEPPNDGTGADRTGTGRIEGDVAGTEGADVDGADGNKTGCADGMEGDVVGTEGTGENNAGKLKAFLQILTNLDNRFSTWLRVSERPGILRNTAIYLAHSGDSWFWMGILFTAWFFSDSCWRKWITPVFFGIAGLALLVFAIKQVFRRKRPKGDWGMIYRNTDKHSFPSGHAARAFFIAFAGIALTPPWFAVLLLLWAPLAALARVAMGVHYLSDIVAGAALGIVSAQLGIQFLEFPIDWVARLTGICLW